MSEPDNNLTGVPLKKCVFKRIRKGAYECGDYLILRTRWVNERWDGPLGSFRAWSVYAPGSHIENRVLLDRFTSLREAYEFVQRRCAKP